MWKRAILKLGDSAFSITGISFNELQIKANVGNSNKMVTINISKEALTTATDKFNGGWYRTPTDNCGISFNASMSIINIDTAYLNGTNVLSNTYWIVLYR